MKSTRLFHVLSVVVILVAVSPAIGFQGFESSTLAPVSDSPQDWGLKIVLLNVGQADAILMFTPNGDVCLIDSGEWPADGKKIADFLKAKTLNGVGDLKTIDLLYTTHYDQDHIGGLAKVVEEGIRIRKAFDQGLSHKRHGKSVYTKYVTALGDTNDNMLQDASEPNFIRHRMDYGRCEYLGLEDEVEIRCVAVRGDTNGTQHDIDLNPANADIDENPGCIALLIRLGEFEFYTAGDQTDDDWKSKPAVEETILDSGAIPGGADIDVLKVSHHGSDTSTSHRFVTELDPEVAVISAKLTGDHLPKRIVLKQLQDDRCYVLITGDGMDPSTQQYFDSSGTHEDDNFVPSDAAVFNNQGNVTIRVSTDGKRYTVVSDSFAKTFSAADTDNTRAP